MACACDKDCYLPPIMPLPHGKLPQGCLGALLAFALLLCGCGKEEEPPLTLETAQALLDEAREAIVTYQYNEAYPMFGRLIEYFEPGTAEWTQAAFGRAIAARFHSPSRPSTANEAAELFANIGEQGHSEEARLHALNNLARMYAVPDYPGDEVDFPQARDVYRKVMATAPEGLPGQVAAVRLVETYTQAYDEPETMREGIRIGKEWLKEYPQKELSAAMWELIGETYQNYLFETENALDAYDEAMSLGWAYPESPLLRMKEMLAMAIDMEDIKRQKRYSRYILEQDLLIRQHRWAEDVLSRLEEAQ